MVCLLPVVAYAGVFYLEHGQFAMTDSTGVFLYSRVMTFADCAKMKVPANELSLCTTVPPAQRPIAQAYIWTAASPLDRFPPSKFSPVPNQLAENFAIRAIEAQPLSYAKAVFDDTWRVFGWKRVVFPNAPTYDEYLFGYRSLPIPAWDQASLGPYDSYAAAYVHGNPLTQVVAPFANVMRLYQRYVCLPGTVYGLILLAGLAGLVLAWRRLGGEALLPWTISLALIVIPAATAEFDYRYVLVAVPFACLAAAMAFSPGTAGGDAGPAAGGPGASGAEGSRPPGSPTSPRSRTRRRLLRAAPATTSVISPRTAPEPAAFFRLGSRGIRPADQGRPLGQFGQRAALDLLVGLGELAAHHGRTVLAVRGGQLGQRRRQPAAGLEVDLGAAVVGQLGEAPGPLALAARREPLEAEPVGGQPGDGQRGRHRRRARQGGHPQAGRGRGRDEPVAGIADPGGARVGDEQDVPARLELAEQLGRAARLDRVVVGDDAGLELDVQARRQPAHPAGVLGRDQGGPGELGHQPGRRVLGPADGDRGQRQHAAALVRLARPARVFSRDPRRSCPRCGLGAQFRHWVLGIRSARHHPASRTLPSPVACGR